MSYQTPPPVFAGRSEVIIIVMVTLLSFIAWLYQYFQPAAPEASIVRWRVTTFTRTVSSREITRPTEMRLMVKGKLGPAEIEWDDRGRVRIASSTCPCHTCVQMGWSAGASLICVPNGLLLEPLNEEAASVDAVSR
ncbi:MAG TPA: NusG domain II-containing protein [Candidatus Rifleibacterium sp.]|nr:NusG domain II-containing protein [Candidatus Rifleibacterium sp.]HPT47380.1 NusG domain II-containing protein [Candidatus Rifleibacterium sp.]